MIDFSIVIQAGGQSSRMGQDKGLVTFGGSTLVEFVLSQVHHYKTESFIISNNVQSYSNFGVPVYPDVIPDIGALGGVYSALYHAKTEYILLLAVDMPFVNSTLLDYLLESAEGYDVVIPQISDDGFLEPFRAVYSRNCLKPIRKMIDQGKRRVISFFDLVRVKAVEQEQVRALDPEGRSFFNVNTPADLAKAKTWLEDKSKKNE